VQTPPPEKENEDEEEEKKKKKEKNKEKKPQENEEESEDNSKRGNPKLHPDYRPPALTNSQMDSIWFETAALFNRFNFYEISEKLIKYVTEETKQNVQYKIEQAKILLYRKEYQTAIEFADSIIKEDQLAYEAYLIKGHSLFFLNRYKEAEDTYIKTIRFKPQEIKFDLEMLVKLGLIYINNKQWYDAKVIFKQILRDNVEHSFGWRYLGFALTKLGEYADAEKALRKANLLDVENPVIWAYLTIYALSTGKKNQALECLNELSKVNFNDNDLLKEIGNLFLEIKEYEVASNIFINVKNHYPTDGDCYLIIAKIYCNKLNKRKEALEILKEGVEKVFNDKKRQEIEYLISKIKQEEEDLFTGVIITDDLYNGSDFGINKKQEEENNLNTGSENILSSVEKSKHSNEENNNSEVEIVNNESKVAEENSN